MALQDVFTATVLIAIVILAGKLTRRKLGLLRRLYLPSSLVGGLIALLLGPQALGWVVRLLAGEEAFLAGGVWPGRVLEVWKQMPGLLISVVFAGLFLGKSLPRPRQIWHRAGPMVMHGQAMAWGQYVVGLLLVILVLTPIWGTNPLAGALIEIGFEGGHGTAAGLADTFAELGFEDGADLALGLATVGVVVGVLLGTVLINWGIARGHIPHPEKVADEQLENEQLSEIESREEVPASERQLDQAVDPLSVHLGLVGLAIGVGWLLLRDLMWLEGMLLVPLGWPELMRHIPLFPLAMIGGVIVQLAVTRAGWPGHVDRKLMNRISGTALDLLIVAAMATLSLAAIGTHMWVFVLLAVAGIAWNLFGLLVLAPRIFPKDWMANGLANFGQGIGMTVIGLLLVRMSDPRDRTGAMEAFGYKQLLFEPIVGGGLFTAASLPLINEFGATAVLIGTAIVMVGWLVCGLWLLKAEREKS